MSPLEPRRRLPWLREAVTVLGFVAAVVTTRSSLADHYQVPTGSMTPTILVGDRVVVSKLSYGLRLPFSDIRLFDLGGPGRGEVAVLRSPENGSTLIKRVVAVPGDRVAVRGGRLWINHAPVPIERDDRATVEILGQRAHAVSLEGSGGPDFGPARLRENDYLVMGDNRGNSHDGRSFGLVGREAFLGRALGVFWSAGRPAWHGL
jgi:signal peptidase I